MEERVEASTNSGKNIDVCMRDTKINMPIS